MAEKHPPKSRKERKRRDRDAARERGISVAEWNQGKAEDRLFFSNRYAARAHNARKRERMASNATQQG